MQRLLLSLSALPLLSTALVAQGTAPCFEQNYGVHAPLTGGTAGFGDDVLFDLQALGFNFPMGANTYTHAHITENGQIFLTQGGATTATTGLGTAYMGLDEALGTTPGDDPRLSPLLMDLWSQPGVSDGVYVNSTIPGKFVVTWANMVEWWATTQAGTPPTFTFQAQIFDTGDVWYFYGPNVDGATYPTQNAVRVIVSRGDGVVDPGPTDLSLGAGLNLSDLVMYEEWLVGPGLFDLQEQTAQFVYAGTGYVQTLQACQPAFHESYGAGCYDISDSFYELADPVGMDLSGQMISGISIGGAPNTGYLLSVAAGPGGIAPGAGALSLPLGDDDQLAAGTLGLTVGSNCWVASGSGNTNGYTPSVADFLNQPSAWWTAWTDLQPNAAGSGLVYYEESGTVATITYDGCYGWGTTGTNTVQFVIDTATGDFSVEFGALSTGNPENWVVGYSPAGPSVDAGSLDISANPSFLLASSNVPALSLTATGAPISTATAGSTVTYTTDNMVEFAPGTYIGLNILSAGSTNPGLDLGFLGAPGCSAFIASLDLAQAMVGASPTGSVTFDIPAGTPTGFEFYSQSVCLVQPNSLPNGQNAFGMITSNGVRSFVASF